MSFSLPCNAMDGQRTPPSHPTLLFPPSALIQAHLDQPKHVKISRGCPFLLPCFVSWTAGALVATRFNPRPERTLPFPSPYCCPCLQRVIVIVIYLFFAFFVFFFYNTSVLLALGFYPRSESPELFLQTSLFFPLLCSCSRCSFGTHSRGIHFNIILPNTTPLTPLLSLFLLLTIIHLSTPTHTPPFVFGVTP